MKPTTLIALICLLLSNVSKGQDEQVIVKVYPFASYTSSINKSVGEKIAGTLELQLILTDRIRLFVDERASYTQVVKKSSEKSSEDEIDFHIRGEVVQNGNKLNVEVYVWEKSTGANKVFSTGYFNRIEIFDQLKKLSEQISQHIILKTAGETKSLGITCVNVNSASKSLKRSVLKNEIPLILFDGLRSSGISVFPWSETKSLCEPEPDQSVDIPELLISGDLTSSSSLLGKAPVSSITLRIYDRSSRKTVTLSKFALIEESELNGQNSRNTYLSPKVANILISDVVNGLKLMNFAGNQLNYGAFDTGGSESQLLADAKSNYEKNNPYLAALYLDQILKRNDRNTQAHTLMAAVKHTQGRFAESNFHEEMAKKLLSQNKKQDVLLEAALYFDKGDYNHSVKILKRGLDLSPYDYEINKRIGECFYNLSQLDSAQKYYSRVANHPESTEGDKYYYSSILMLLEEFDRAIYQLNQLLLLESENRSTYESSIAQAYAQLANDQLMEGNAAEAMRLAQKSNEYQINYNALIIQIDESLSEYDFVKTDSLLQLGLNEHIIQDDEHYYLGMALYDEFYSNPSDTSIATYAISLLLKYDQYLGYPSIATQYAGFLSAQIGNNEEAKRYLADVLDYEPTDPMNYFNLAEVQIVDLKSQEASTTIRGAMKHLDSEDRERRILSAYLETMAVMVGGKSASKEMKILQNLLEGDSPIYTTWSFKYFLDSMKVLGQNNDALANDLINVTNQVKSRFEN